MYSCISHIPHNQTQDVQVIIQLLPRTFACMRIIVLNFFSISRVNELDIETKENDIYKK
jgi:hypothetical protein